MGFLTFFQRRIRADLRFSRAISFGPTCFETRLGFGLAQACQAASQAPARR